MTGSRESVSHCIDNICQLGCDAVRDTIKAIEKGEMPEAVSSLDSEERRGLLTELRDIMAVYDYDEEDDKGR